jgi:hypothetical protein
VKFNLYGRDEGLLKTINIKTSERMLRMFMMITRGFDNLRQKMSLMTSFGDKNIFFLKIANIGGLTYDDFSMMQMRQQQQ